MLGLHIPRSASSCHVLAHAKTWRMQGASPCGLMLLLSPSLSCSLESDLQPAQRRRPRRLRRPHRTTPGVQTITVTLTDTTVNASQATVQSGVRYHFLVTNRGAHPHQFWLSPQGMAQMMGQMPMAQWRQQILYGSQDIGPGMMTSFDYTFTRQMMQQRLAYGCYTANGQTVIQMPLRVNP